MQRILSLGIIFLLAGYSAVAQAVVAVRNDYQPQEIKQQAEYYAHVLGLDSTVYILISFTPRVPEKMKGFTRYHDARPQGGGHQVHISISKKAGRSHQLRTLAHEMVHARQFVQGQLVQCDHTHFSWHSQACERLDKLAYLDRPWEQEATKVGASLHEQFRKQSQNRLASLH
ncbi:MAG: hypothetical protein ACFB15_27785 [Cyclobacteriaceae bacterium]